MQIIHEALRVTLDNVMLATGDPMTLRAACEARSPAQANQRRQLQDSRCRGFVYLLSDGSIESCPCDSFDPRMVTLDDQAGYGDKESNSFQDHEIENLCPYG